MQGLCRRMKRSRMQSALKAREAEDEEEDEAASAKAIRREWLLSAAALAVLNSMQLEGKLCDVVITVDDVEFKAHRNVLGACSEYFSVLFTSGLVQPEKRIYSIPGVSAHIMPLLMEYAYTRSITVTMTNVEELLVAADYLSMLDLVQVCCDFLQSQLCPENCIGIWGFADMFSCLELRRRAYLYILQHFEETARISEEFLELSLPQLAAIIEEDELNVEQESVVFEAVLHWINHRAHERRDHMALLLPKVRLGLLTESYFLNNVKNNALVKDSTECKPIVMDAQKAMCDFTLNGPSGSAVSHPLTRPRLPYAFLRQ